MKTIGKVTNAEPAKPQSPIDIDAVIDAFETDIACNGIRSVDVRAHGMPLLDHADRGLVSHTIIELLRVWMEHRWQSLLPTTAEACKECFPEIEFDEAQIESLRFEENRLRAQLISRSTSGHRDQVSLDELPQAGQKWCDFELLDVLGEGAFARVYLARQRTMADRLVALKLTFRRTTESSLLARLQHSAIVPIYSIHDSERIFGICMPYLGNTTLADLLLDNPGDSRRRVDRGSSRKADGGKSILSTLAARNNRITTIVNTPTVSSGAAASSAMPIVGIGQVDSETLSARKIEDATVSPILVDAHQDVAIINSPVAHLLAGYDYVESVLWIVAQLADALACAHRAGILHSDIKPANILLAADGQPRLLDFNVAHATDNPAAQKQLLGGTIAYMAPEHFRALHDPSQLIDARSDIYSLGLVLFQMLTGRLPKNATNFENWVKDAEKPSSLQALPSVKLFNPKLSPAVVAIVDHCLSQNPSQRYQNASDLHEDLMAHLEHRTLIHQTEPSWMERVSKWWLRHPRLSSAGTIATLASVVLIVCAIALYVRGRQLQFADWERRWSQFELLEPETISYLAAIDVAPELAAEAAGKLSDSLALVTLGKNSDHLDQAFLSSRGPEQRRRIESRLGALASLSAKLNQDASRDKIKPFEVPPVLTRLHSSDPTSSGGGGTAIVDYLKRDFAGASDTLKAQLGVTQQDYASWLMLGNCYAGLQDFESAQQCYTACMALRPAIVVPQFFRGIARLQAGQFNAAIDDFDAVTKRRTDWTSAYFNRALAEQAMGRFSDALVSLNKAIDRGDRSVQTYSIRAQIQSSLGHEQERQSDNALALAATPKTEEDWVVHALLNLDAGNIEIAVNELRETLARFPRSLDARQNLSHIYADVLGQSQLAMEELNALIEKDPTNPVRLAGRAVIHARQGRVELALDDLRQATAYEPKQPIIQYQIASCFSLIAAQLENGGLMNGDRQLEFENAKMAAQHWFAKSILHDPQLMPLIESDDDFVWFRARPEYVEIRQALQVLVDAQQSQPTSGILPE